MDTRNREIRLVGRPRGVPDESLFELVESEAPEPADGQVLIRNSYISVDPYMTDHKSTQQPEQHAGRRRSPR